MRCAQHSDRPVILLDYDFDALLHLGQHGMELASHFRFAPMDRCHSFIMTLAPCPRVDWKPLIRLRLD